MVVSWLVGVDKSEPNLYTMVGILNPECVFNHEVMEKNIMN